MHPLSKPLADAIAEIKKYDTCKSEISTLEALCTTGATLESLLEHKQAPYWAYWYAFNIIKGRWPEAEATIMTSPQWAFWYSYNVIKGRWPEAEETIMSDPKWVYMYARYVIGGSWPEAEETIMSDLEWASRYRKHVLKSESISMV